MRKKTKNRIRIAVVIFILVSIVIGLFASGNLKFPFSIISTSTITFEDGGKVYWVASGVGDSIDEGFSFTYKVGSNIKDYEKDNGVTVQPRTSMTLYFSKKNSQCKYTLVKTYKSILLGLLKPDYYILTNPTRIADIEIRDSNGKTAILNGAVNGDSKTLTDTDGSGSVTVKSIGLIASSQDCPNYENVAVVKDGKGNYKIADKNDYETRLNRASGVWNLLGILNYLFSEVRDNSQFTSGFDSYPIININSQTVTGNIEIGSGLFTITADQDYFDSVLYTPPKQAEPKITKIDVSDITQGTTASVRVDIKNNADTKGTVLLTATSQNSGIAPVSTNFVLDSQVSKYFTLTASEYIGTGRVCFNACSTSQFESSSCDEQCKSFSITSKQTTFCGDGVCQSSENNATCPQDCKINCVEESEECSSGDNCCSGLICSDNVCIKGYGKCGSCDANVKSKLLGWISPSKIRCEPTLAQKLTGCIFSWIKIVFVLIILIFIPLFGFSLFDGMLKNIINKKQPRKLVSLILGLLLAFGIGALLFALLSSPAVWVIGTVSLAVVIAFKFFVGGKVDVIKGAVKNLRGNDK